MSLLIRPPTLATDMRTHLHKYNKYVCNQISLITSLKITTDALLMAGGYLNTYEKSEKCQSKLQEYHSYMHTYLRPHHIFPDTILK